MKYLIRNRQTRIMSLINFYSMRYELSLSVTHIYTQGSYSAKMIVSVLDRSSFLHSNVLEKNGIVLEKSATQRKNFGKFYYLENM